MTYVCEPSWSQVPFKDAGHVHVHQWTSLPMLEKQDRVRYVLADSWYVREFLQGRREYTISVRRVLGKRL